MNIAIIGITGKSGHLIAAEAENAVIKLQALYATNKNIMVMLLKKTL